MPLSINFPVVSADGGDVVGGGSISMVRSVSPTYRGNRGLTVRGSKKKDNSMSMMEI